MHAKRTNKIPRRTAIAGSLVLTGLMLIVGAVAYLTTVHKSARAAGQEVVQTVPQPSSTKIVALPQPKNVVVKTPTAAEICKQLDGQVYNNHENVDTSIGLIDSANCWVKGTMYSVEKFSSTPLRDKWVAEEKPFGMVAKWQGQDWTAVWLDQSQASMVPTSAS